MKVLHVVSGLAKAAGGTTEAVPKICLAQAKAGAEVALVAFDYGELPEMLKEAIKERGEAELSENEDKTVLEKHVQEFNHRI